MLENKIYDISGLARKLYYIATNAALITVENEIPNISNSVIKTDYLKLKSNLLIRVMINILLLQNLVRFQQKFLMQD